MGSKWSAYYPDDPGALMFEDHETFEPNFDRSKDAKAREGNVPATPTRTRPSFSSASVRAANSAKAKLSKKDPLQNSAAEQMSKSDR